MIDGLKNTLKYGIASLAFGLSSCGNVTEDVEGIVKEEFGTAAILVESRNMDGPDNIDLLAMTGSLNYGVVLETAKGEYIINVRNNPIKPLLSLAKAIEPGDKIRIEGRWGNSENYIGRDGIGTVYGNYIEIIEKAKK